MMENALLMLPSLRQLHPLLPLCHPHTTALTACSSIIGEVLEITLLLRWQQREELCPSLGRSWPETPSFGCSPPHSQAAQPTALHMWHGGSQVYTSLKPSSCSSGSHAHHKPLQLLGETQHWCVPLRRHLWPVLCTTTMRTLAQPSQQPRQTLL